MSHTKVDTWHNAIPSRQGAGVNVAIIDVGGFQGYATELGDELPAVVTKKKNFCGTNPDVFDSTFTGDPHGTEVAAIVHDMAPTAGISLISAMNDAEIVAAQNYILTLNGDANAGNDIRIVNASFGDPTAGRGDGSGGANTVDGVVRNLRQHNVLWVASAGNEGDVHDGFVPAGPDGIDNFGNRFVAWQPDNFEDGFAVAGQTVNVRIKWDSWSGAPQDFDLIIFDQAGQVVASSQRPQGSGATPVEAASVKNFGSNPVVFYTAIKRTFASANPRFDTYVLYADSELVDARSSISEPADSPYAFTVGATCVTDKRSSRTRVKARRSTDGSSPI